MKKIIALLIFLALIGCAPQEQPVPAIEAEPTPLPEPEPAPIVAPAPEPTPVTAPEPAVSPGPTTATDPILLKQGTFKDVTHRTSGTVKIYLQPEGKQLMTMTGFDTTPGPGLSVVLHTGNPASGFEVGRLISASGNYPYDLPSDLDVSPYTHVSIYSKKYNVVYGEAKLR